MPNWCDNTIHITGNEHDIKSLWDEIKPDDDGGHPDLTKAFPIPAQHEAGWYEWCNENWGTKWAPEFDGDLDTTGIWLAGDSAWSPPIALLRNVAMRYPRLTFRIQYSEVGCDFAGAMVIQNVHSAESTSAISDRFTCDEPEDSTEYFDALMDFVDDLRGLHAEKADSVWKQAYA